jgi:hypothetical protein
MYIHISVPIYADLCGPIAQTAPKSQILSSGIPVSHMCLVRLWTDHFNCGELRHTALALACRDYQHKVSIIKPNRLTVENQPRSRSEIRMNESLMVSLQMALKGAARMIDAHGRTRGYGSLLIHIVSLTAHIWRWRADVGVFWPKSNKGRRHSGRETALSERCGSEP